MGKDPAFPMYANDWLSSSSITQMTAEEERGYLRLLCHCWASGDCSLDRSDAALGALSLLGEDYFNNPSSIVRRRFIDHPSKPGSLTNKRLFKVWEERQEWREKCRQGGVKSGMSRRSVTKGSLNTVRSKPRTKREVKGNSSSSSSSSSKGKPPKPPLAFQIEFPLGFDTAEVRLAWNDWLKHKPTKYKNHETAGKSLRTYCRQFETPQRLILGIELAIAGTWKGLSLDATIQSERAKAGGAADPRGNMAAMREFMESDDES